MDAPYTKKREQQFRGPAKTSDYNQRIEENYKDLTLLYNKARISETELDDILSRMAKDQLSLSRELNSLLTRIDALEAGSTYRTFQGTSTIDNDRFIGDGSFEIPSEEQLTFDDVHSLFSLPMVSSGSASKVIATDSNGNEFVPPSFETRVDGNDASADTGAAYIDSTDPKYAAYSKPGIIWERNVVRDAAVGGGAELDLYVRMPLELQTSDKANAIVIHPFPYFGTTLKDISISSAPEPSLDPGDGYVTLNNSAYFEDDLDAVGWVAPGGWASQNDVISNCGPKKFYFPSKQVTAVKITLSQPDYYLDSSKYVYTYGMTKFDVRKDAFLSSGRAMIKIDAADATTISSVDSVVPQIYNIDPALWSQAFSYRVIWETSFGSGTYTTTPVPSSQRVWLEITLNKVSDTTPALSGFTLQYS